MNIKQLTLENTYIYSFHVRQDKFPRNHHTWHYHEELELMYIQKGSGTLFIGDCIQPFTPDTFVLIGKNTPHYWFFDQLDTNEEDSLMSCIVIHFKENSFGELFMSCPEMNCINQLLVASKKGLFIYSKNNNRLKSLFEDMLESKGSYRIINFLTILTLFSEQPYNSLVSDSYDTLNHQTDEKRMNRIMEYIQFHYRSNISISELANEAQLTRNSLCRYFKQKTGKTPIQFIMELRIAHACRLLRDQQMSLKEICYECGFNNLVHFHKSFKVHVAISPNVYRKNKGIKN